MFLLLFLVVFISMNICVCVCVRMLVSILLLETCSYFMHFSLCAKSGCLDLLSCMRTIFLVSFVLVTVSPIRGFSLLSN